MEDLSRRSTALDEDFAGLVDYVDECRPGARRFDVGQRTSFGLVPMAVAAAEQLLEWTLTAVAASLRTAIDQIAPKAMAFGLTISRRDQRGPHILGIEVPRGVANGTGRRLSDAAVVASVRGTSLRIAPHLHTAQADIDRLLSALSTLAQPEASTTRASESETLAVPEPSAEHAANRRYRPEACTSPVYERTQNGNRR